jgi:hypothetical protein
MRSSKLDLEADLDDNEIVEITAPDIEITIHDTAPSLCMLNTLNSTDTIQ